MHLSNLQLLHREYLKSPLWQKKREEAIACFGATCRRCGQHGTDVHHKTYERTGGKELLSDLEILCRPCHEAHHRIERAQRPKCRRNKVIPLQALYRYLTKTQQRRLCEQFGLTSVSLFNAITDASRNDVVGAAKTMLGVNACYGATVLKPSKTHGVGLEDKFALQRQIIALGVKPLKAQNYSIKQLKLMIAMKQADQAQAVSF